MTVVLPIIGERSADGLFVSARLKRWQDSGGWDLIIIHLLGLALAGCSTAPDNGPWAMPEMVQIGEVTGNKVTLVH
jgi:hypothetical protein